ncbi:unnamed protein product [Enterobius vermicularis]|uniref:PlsC domain-containing protein n=1 Tax=Enterobius vermicularis TaxID=51028 RepID=A0A0N4UYM0_ENTVE|nr:unnamed protein product [Enterobius vermicularis]
MWVDPFLNQLREASWPHWLEPYVEVLLLWISWAIDYVDWDYLEYLTWLFLPLFLCFLLPVILLLFIYGCAIFLHVYGLRNRIREAYADSIWDGARISVASFWDAVGHIWHGYEIDGLEYIPDKGSALLVYYHGNLPLDVYYVIAKCLLHKKRTLHCVGDKFIFKIPGWGKMCKIFCVIPGTREDCIELLNNGHLLCIAPGGLREALFSDPARYNLMWAKRLGFARVIVATNTVVIPMFTENCRDAFRTPTWGRKMLRWIYEKTRLPLCPIYGGFPVKMITHLGEPIRFPEGVTPEDVRKRVKHEVRGLIIKHQLLPGSILRGIKQRFYDKRTAKQDILLRNVRENEAANEELGQISESSFNNSGCVLENTAVVNGIIRRTP